MEIERKLTELAVIRAQAKMDAANKARAQLESEKKATELAQAKARAEADALAIIEKRIELEAKAIEETMLRESVERMANEALIARSEENKKATAAATQRIRAALAVAESPQEKVSEISLQLLNEESTTTDTRLSQSDQTFDHEYGNQIIDFATTRRIRANY
jgi:membrane protein involved in colicin uptake